MKTAVLLINLGTPDSPEVSDGGKYLKEFLNDSRVIDL
jgi:ferrochelatase